jgi:copper chaperone NosL
MTRTTRLLLAVAAAAMLVATLLPLWEVRLVAPQYPEGLGLQILSHTVRGLGPNDLNSINMLNHYIGMKSIVPESIPELRFMPWLIVALAGGLLAIAWRGSRRWLLLWLAVVVVAGVVGLWDFWRWEYDYGHNLDLDTAVIIVPGMSYQPPLIGSKQLLNFVATAWPGSGAILLGLAWIIAVGAWWTSGRRARRLAHPVLAAVTAGLLLTTTGCGPAIPAIALHLDECHYCRMIISDDRFAAAAITASGRTVRFDSVECLAEWAQGEATTPSAMWVSDAAQPGTLISVSEARFHRDTTVGSQMGRGWMAAALNAAPPSAIEWSALTAAVQDEAALPVGQGALD